MREVLQKLTKRRVVENGSLRFLFSTGYYKNGVKVRKLVALVVKWRNRLGIWSSANRENCGSSGYTCIKHCFFRLLLLSSIDSWTERKWFERNKIMVLEKA